MKNPFEDADSAYFVLVNSEGQHSLWPSFAEIPAGWTTAFGEADREACLTYVAQSWSDMRPKSLVIEDSRKIRN
ncbi:MULTISPECIES: MbtH family protein [unclassified Streptomyces]|uniref:MbtH family protein n=1 Tax=Streptomyces sp. cf386 TaxID=1761904 RepID=UPI000B899E56|nr:MbtH family protein [Streptomyces sp. cf386]